ncbi:MAG: DUF4388 domain-containing protein [bacterium]|nr:DUF4388 domain-containing protein [bacterium]
MAIKGDLETVNLPDVLQLLGTAGKTGALSIRRGLEEKRIYFDKGRPVFASSSDEREKLGNVLLKQRRFDEADLETARLNQEESGKRLGLVMLEMGLITRDDLVAGLKTQAQMVTTTLFQWWGGEFEFIEQPLPFPDEVMVGFNLNSMIMEAAKAVDDWNRVQSKLPDLDVVVRLSAVEDKPEVALSADEWNVLSLVDGRMNVIGIADTAPGSDIEVCLLIILLLDKGLLEVVEEEESEPTLSGGEKDVILSLITVYNELFAQMSRYIRTNVGEDASTAFGEAVWSYCTGFSPLLDRSWRPVMGNFDRSSILGNITQLDPEERTHKLSEVLLKILKEEVNLSVNYLSGPQVSGLLQQLTAVAEVVLRENDPALTGLGVRAAILSFLNPGGVISYEKRPVRV